MRLRLESWLRLSEAIAEGTTRVVLPTIAVEEAKRGGIAARRKIARDLAQSGRHLTAAAKAQLELVIRMTEKEADGYSDWLDQRLTELGFEVIDAPEASHEDVALRAMDRRRPFNDAGGGYRDTLHWLSLIALIRKYPAEDFVLVTDDKGGFLNKAEDGLHEHLVEEAASLLEGGTLSLSRKISDVTPQGRYRRTVEDLGLSELLKTEIEITAVTRDFYGVIPPRDVGFPDSDWIEFRSISGFAIETLTIHELATSRDLEGKFGLTANVEILATDISLDNDEIDFIEKVEARKLRFDGAFSAPADQASISVSELTSTLVGQHTADVAARVREAFAGIQGPILAESVRRAIADMNSGLAAAIALAASNSVKDSIREIYGQKPNDPVVDEDARGAIAAAPPEQGVDEHSGDDQVGS